MPDIPPPELPARRITGAALYVCEPGPRTSRELLAATAQIARSKGWTIIDGASIVDSCLLTTPPQDRPGWSALRGLARLKTVHVVVVPEALHLGWTWNIWRAEQQYLQEHGVSLASVKPMLDAILTGVRP
ncbi:hypothetical protein ACIRQY_33535 [Streptomyces sp. NPDC101490]|uniref:hypothetical protein n=1 Tax=Streptomyces sp. NPDC101490 TaxID=3366143 RepID=UPI00380D7648